MVRTQADLFNVHSQWTRGKVRRGVLIAMAHMSIVIIMLGRVTQNSSWQGAISPKRALLILKLSRGVKKKYNVSTKKDVVLGPLREIESPNQSTSITAEVRPEALGHISLTVVSS